MVQLLYWPLRREAAEEVPVVLEAVPARVVALRQVLPQQQAVPRRQELPRPLVPAESAQPGLRLPLNR